MGRDSWGGSGFSAAEKKASMAEAQEKFEAERRERDQRARSCQCRSPRPSLRSYLGTRVCKMCQRPIANE